jgi:hypothetical protein
MHLAVTGAFQARWTADIHEEWMRNLLRQRPDLTRVQIDRTRAMMDAHAEGCLVEGYRDRIGALALPDPGDRHVLAAALEAEAGVIVTLNIKHFPEAILKQHNVTAQRPDEFLCGLYDRDATTVCTAVRNQRAMLRNPPKDVSQHLATLIQNGLVESVGRLRPHATDL